MSNYNSSSSSSSSTTSSGSGSGSAGGGGGGSFAISDAQITFAGNLAFGCTIPGTCACFLVLVCYAAAAYFPKARKQLDRVSFRLLVYTLFFNVLFGIAYAATPTAPGWGCNLGAFAVNFTLSFSTFFTTCIAINLQLVLVHGVNGKAMEKYYVIGTVILSLALNVPTFALHQFGWDEESATCWYKNHDPAIRLRWIIGTQSFWISLAATIETIASCVVLLWMYRFHRFTQVLVQAASQSTSGKSNTTKNTTSLFRFASASRSTVLTQDPRYRNVILRIALYPIVSLMVNYSTVALDLNTTIRGLNTQLDYRLLVLDLILYGIRTLAYGVLAAGDPSFMMAIREIRGRKRSTGGDAGRTMTSLRFAPGKGKSGATPSHGGTTQQQQHVEGGKTGQGVETQLGTTRSETVAIRFVGVEDTASGSGLGGSSQGGLEAKEMGRETETETGGELELEEIHRQL